MGVYQRGIPINIVERYYAIDPLTEEATPTDPTTVTFTVRYPDDSDQVFVAGLNSEVSHAGVGIYILSLGLDAPLPPGTYRYESLAAGAVEASNEGLFTVLESGVLEPIAVSYPTPGPCSTWINGEDVAECCDVGVGSDTFLLEDVAAMSSHLLFEISGRQFPGVCERTERPCRTDCRRWESVDDYYSYVTLNGPSSACGCPTESTIKLPGYPIREILEVKIDGAVVAANEYRLDGKRYLIRLSDPGPPITRRVWPSCQDITLPDTEARTFSLRYRYGIDPPELGRKAAAQLACELWKACPGNDGDCRLPNKVTRIVRQGITIEKIVPLAEFLKTGATGLQLVDTFIAATNPHGGRRRSAVWTPDGPRSRRIG